MNLRIILLTIVLSLCTVVTLALSSEMKTQDKPKKANLTCDGEEYEEDAEATKISQECTKETETRNSDEKKQAKDKKTTELDPCLMACIMSKKGQLTSDGKIDTEKVKKAWKDSKFPEKAKEPLMKAAQKCGEENPGVFSTDDGCSSYKNLTNCITKAIIKICYPNVTVPL